MVGEERGFGEGGGMMKQRTPEWMDARVGRITGSRFADVMARPGTEAYEGLVRDLAWERFTGRPLPTYQSPAMQRGVELESEARDWLAFERGEHIRQVGFLTHPDFSFVGCSPDGLIDPDMGVEIKCPLHRAYMEVVRTREVPARYRWQVQGSLWVSGRRAWLFCAYHPELGGVVVDVERDEQAIKQLQERCIQANIEIEEWVKQLRAA